MLSSSFSSVVFQYEPQQAVNVNAVLTNNWAFTKEERRFLRHAIKDHKDWTFVDVPLSGSRDSRYFAHKNNLQSPVFCVQKIGSAAGNPTYEFRLPWEDGQATAEFTDLLGKISTRLKKALPAVKPHLSLIHNG